MYQSYFGLNEQAFSIAVDPRYLYMSRQHQEALAHLVYGVQGGGFVMLSGEVGTGKTTIVKQLLEKLPKDTDIAIILNPMSNVIELLSTICDELEIGYYDDDITIKALTDALYEFLLKNHSNGRNTVLLIDEAQLLSAEVLEQLRLLTNLETNAKKLLQIILVGQPELNSLLAQPRLRQLSQRITARFHLKPLNSEETYAYIRHRLSVAGMPPDRNPFSESIIRKIHEFTGGIPRRINVLCERLLIGAFGHNKHKIDKHILELAKSEVTYNLGERNSNGLPYWLLPTGVGFACALLTLLVMWAFIPSISNTPNDTNHESQASKVGQQNSARINPITDSTPVRNISKDVSSANFPLSLDAPFLFDSIIPAQNQLFAYLKIDTGNNINPCWNKEINYACERNNVYSWQDLRDINRPAILTFTLPGKLRAYGIVTGMNGANARLTSIRNNRIEHYTLALSDLGDYWTGDYSFVWHRPEGFKEQLVVGQSSPAVRWLAKKFAEIDNKSTPLAQDQFNNILEKRVQIFQKNNGLQSDGIVGTATLLKINETTGLDKTLDGI